MAQKRTDWIQVGQGKSYFHRVHQPLQCLIFILPLLLIYQIGAALLPHIATLRAAKEGHRVDVVAFILMQRFFALFGAAGTYLPLAAVVAILLAWHIARRDSWTIEPPLYGGMAAESFAWAIPVFVIGLAVFRHAGPAGVGVGLESSAGGGLNWQTEAVLSVGAGVYEELLFRLIAITLLNIVFVDVFELKIQNAIPLIIVTSAVMFSAYHYLGAEHFEWATFFFRSAAGVYFAGIFIFRGFGIVVGCHAIYDLMVVLLNHR